jgi:hypothetical protein
MPPALLSVAFQRTISPAAEKYTDVEIRKSYTKYLVKNKVGQACCACGHTYAMKKSRTKQQQN